MRWAPRPLAARRFFAEALDGSPAVPIGEGTRRRRCLQTGSGCSRCPESNLVLLPTGAGATVTLPKGDVVRVGEGAWLGDSKRIVFTGDPGDNKPRGYIQEIPAGVPRAITPEGVALAGKAAVRDDNSILGRVGATWVLFPIHGGDGQPVPALSAGDIPLQWSQDGRYVYTVDNVAGPGRQPLMSFAWSSRPAAGFSGKRSRRPTRWESKT